MRALVFGATGLIGRAVVQALLAKDHEVIGTSRSTSQNLFTTKAYTHVCVDITRSDDFTQLKGKFDCVFNVTGYVPPSRLPSETLKCFQANTLGTQNILEYMLANDLYRLIHSSSVTVYGKPSKLYVKEDSPLMPVLTYGVSKHSAESFCNMYSQLYGIEITMLRYSPVYGPGFTQRTALSIFIEKAMRNEAITLFQKGKRSQDYVFSHDAAAANLLAAEQNIAGVYNIASGELTTMKTLAKTIIGVFGSTSKIHYDTSQPEEFSIGIDIQRAVNILGYSPSYSLREGLVQYRDSLLAH